MQWALLVVSVRSKLEGVKQLGLHSLSMPFRVDALVYAWIGMNELHQRVLTNTVLNGEIQSIWMRFDL
jgi:hypothetical protein